MKKFRFREGPTFAKGVWTVLCGVGGLAAALRTAARGDCWTSHLDGFVSNDRGELFTLERTETRHANISHQSLTCYSTKTAPTITSSSSSSLREFEELA